MRRGTRRGTQFGRGNTLALGASAFIAFALLISPAARAQLVTHGKAQLPRSAARLRGVSHEEVRTGSSTGSATVTTTSNLTGVSGQLYLAAVSSRPQRVVSSVSGLGLLWFPVDERCSGRGQTMVALWGAFGAPTGDSPVTVQLDAAATNVVLAVSRYSGVDTLAPLGNGTSANTNGTNGACRGGTDDASYAFGLTSTVPRSVAFAAVAMRGRSHTPGTGYSERVELSSGDAGDTASLAFVDREVAPTGTFSIDGSFSGAVDWAAVGVVLEPAGSSAPAPDIDVTPPTGDYGAVVTGTTAPNTFVVGNFGNVNLSVSGTSLFGPDAGEFSLASGAAPFVLTPGTTRDVVVSFAPASEGQRNATLRITSGDPDEAQLDVPLTGTGVTVAGSGGIWISAAELALKPTSGPAWDAVLATADGVLEPPDIGDNNSGHDVQTLAVALVYARTGGSAYRMKARDAILSAIGTEVGATSAVQLGRNVVCYVLSADLIGLGAFDPAADTTFRAWIAAIRTVAWPDGSIVSQDEERANNHGRMCGMTRAAIAVYLGDLVELERCAQVFHGFLGDRATYDGFLWTHDLSWQADEANPVGINPLGAVKLGTNVGGALTEEMRRGGPLQAPPIQTGYPWEALQGILVEAVILERAGYDVFTWEDQAILRAVQFLNDLQLQYPTEAWWARGDDTWSPWIVNTMYGTAFPTEGAAIGKCMGWTDWTHAP